MVLASVAWAACSTAGPAAKATAQIEPGKSFTLKAGESLAVSDALRIGFDGVTADSRCAKGEQCVWAGEAKVRIWWQQGASPRAMRDLRTAAPPADRVRVVDHELRLVRVEPAPVSGKSITAADYSVTLMLSRNTAGEAERQ